MRAQQVRSINAHDKLARMRATCLLLEHLTPDQRKTFRTNRWFIVEGGKTKTRYRIRASEDLVGNIDVLVADNDNKISHRLCGHCGLTVVPLGDQLLAQKLMLQYDEDKFLKLANRHAA